MEILENEPPYTDARNLAHTSMGIYAAAHLTLTASRLSLSVRDE